jgi:hypothetical protein
MEGAKVRIAPPVVARHTGPPPPDGARSPSGFDLTRASSFTSRSESAGEGEVAPQWLLRSSARAIRSDERVQ